MLEPVPTERPPAADVLYLVGTSGHPNFGDEFIAASWLRFLARARPGAEVWLDCPHPGLASHLFDGLHPGLRTTDTLWRLAFETTGMDPAAADAHVDRVVTHLGSPRYDLGLLGARRASSVHILGGGYLNSIWPHHARLLRAALRLRQVSGARLAATGLGLAPATDAEGLRAALGAFDHATVRDAPSAQLARADRAPDDAFLGLPGLAGFTGAPAEGTDDGDVWVCLQSDMTEPGILDGAVAAVRAALTGPALAGRTVRYLEAIPGADRAAFDRLADLVPEENFVPFTRLWQEGFPARPGQTWITSRFHFHLLAAACGAEGTALEVSPDYYRVKHQSLLEAGTGWSVTPTGGTEPYAPARSHAFPATAARLHRTKLREAEELYPAAAAPEDDPAGTEPRTRPGRTVARFLRR
ncbi:MULTISPECIES: polysaccharide pyruvyl transferase family protein [Kocuria]|uniref:polysaccharide pyruvyl transferase family protein n=1 Tax=Kocuria TaxID=57493 RepID=UPI000689C376|nr:MULTISPECIES: polysaccharide pyruvyl transferase family protein [Kocuria]MCC5783789.1 polysaccharide pyruvyl transferase family protein [Kocuria sp. CCUG 69068]MCM3487467.1 polysaccharide pyruvyl transferase family protein [Kocuria rosea]MEB2527845.1 polysaccharide pyruvyl transferase family protein [Kocuria rosea]MEB2617705.1 polysaccharide pyruvyl transferase family protein [Kocuria rosea]NVC23500.1 polysaccharide pyruvyl transferase family protein [Kocuria salina]